MSVLGDMAQTSDLFSRSQAQSQHAQSSPFNATHAFQNWENHLKIAGQDAAPKQRETASDAAGVLAIEANPPASPRSLRDRFHAFTHTPQFSAVLLMTYVCVDLGIILTSITLKKFYPNLT